MSIIKERLEAGKIVRTMHVVGYATPRVIELTGLLGNFHGVWFDQEHSAIPHATLEMMLIACRAAKLDAFARVAPTDYATVMRPMETGCSGVMIAQVRTLDEVEQAVSWAKYPPMGSAACSAAMPRPATDRSISRPMWPRRIAIVGCRFKLKRRIRRDRRPDRGHEGRRLAVRGAGRFVGYAGSAGRFHAPEVHRSTEAGCRGGEKGGEGLGHIVARRGTCAGLPRIGLSVVQHFRRY